MKNKKILIVEDEALAAKAMQITLASAGYTGCFIVNSGESAIKTTEEKNPDVVLMDITLKGSIDGIAAAEKIRSFSKIPIIFLTGHQDEKILAKANLIKGTSILFKPAKFEVLENAIIHALVCGENK